jgi:type II secretory pathway component GspD/PulD (secretin)
VASELKEIFQSADSDITRASTRNSVAGRIGRGGGGGGGFPGMFGGGGGGGGSTDETKNAQTHTVFVSDDQMNAVVASAPPDYMSTISNVVLQLDKPSQDVTQIHVFRLKHADPTEIADELSNLFPTTSSTSGQNNRTMGFQFRGPFGPFGGGGGGGNTQSARMKQQSTVLAVADRRTQSVVVTTSSNLMTEITGMISDLDEGPMGVQHVWAYPIDSADPASVQETMTTLFAGTQSRTQTTTTTALSARQNANNNSQSSTTSSSSGFGTTGASGLR